MSPYVLNLRERVGHDLLLLPAVSAVIRRDDGYLLCRSPQSRLWGLVGGGIEPRETPADAVIREVHEEIGVRAHVHGIVGAYGGDNLLTRYPNGDLVGYTTTAFACSVADDGELEFVDGELDETGWFTREEIAQLPRDPMVDAVIEDADRMPGLWRRGLHPVVEKAVCYVIAEDHLLVLVHDDLDLMMTGVQVPAGTVRDDETPSGAAERELFEETGLRGKVTHSLGTAHYDLFPSRDECAVRHFFRLEVGGADIHAVWQAGEDDAETGGPPVSWTCRWIPLSQAHVLAGGLSARLGAAARSLLHTPAL